MQASLYAIVTLLHVTADLVFAAGLLAGLLVVSALAREPAERLAKDRRLIDGMRRWNRFVTGPALVLAWALGLWLAHAAGWLGAGWLQWKLLLVLFVSALHGVLSVRLRRLAATPAIPPRPGIWVAVPLAIAAFAGIGWLALVKPF